MRIELSTGTPAELVHPQGIDTPTKGLVVFPDILGLRPLFDDLCRRLSDEQGWVVCAPEPFPGGEQLGVGERLVAMADASDDRFRRDAVAAADATGCDRVVAIGFCMGGMLAFKAAGSGRFDRTAGFYGMIRLPTDWVGPMHADAIDTLRAWDRCPVMAVIGLSLIHI